MISDLKTVIVKIIETYNRNSEKYKMTLKNERDDVFTIYHSKFKRILSLSVGYRIDEKSRPIICVGTLIGAGNGGSDYNRSVFERLKCNVNAEDTLEVFYKGCNFVSGIRLNTFKTNVWFTAENFNSLKDYIKQFDKIPVTRYRISQQQCIEDLNTRHALGQFQRLHQYRYRFYHWLEFLEILEYLDGTRLVEKDFESVEKILLTAIEKHLEGMKLVFKVRQIRNKRKEMS